MSYRDAPRVAIGPTVPMGAAYRTLNIDGDPYNSVHIRVDADLSGEDCPRCRFCGTPDATANPFCRICTIVEMEATR
jgi:hypothetical protein